LDAFSSHIAALSAGHKTVIFGPRRSTSLSEIVIARQFRGPPQSGNGGYVAGIVGREFESPATVALRALIPLDTPLDVVRENGRVMLAGKDGTLIAEGRAALSEALPLSPEAPSLDAARKGSDVFARIEKPFHPPCFTCSTLRDDGDGLRVFAARQGDEPGHIAGVWTPNARFADQEGLVLTEIVWAALDCPGSFAWLDKLGHTGGLLGTMTLEIHERPRVGVPHIITAWPLEHAGRKYQSGVALFNESGRLLARGHQIWIGRAIPNSFPQP
jgi:hypothetical protein